MSLLEQSFAFYPQITKIDRIKLDLSTFMSKAQSEPAHTVTFFYKYELIGVFFYCLLFFQLFLPQSPNNQIL